MHQNKKDDNLEIIKACVKGDLRAQEALYKKYYGYGMAVALRYSNNIETAREVLNDSFLKLYTKIHQFKRNLDLKGWFRRIIINTAIDYHRKDKSYNFEVPMEQEDYICEEVVVNGMMVDDLLKVIQKLSPTYQLVFNLYEIEGYSCKEIGQDLNISESTVRSNLARAKQKLKKLIHEYEKGQF